MCISYFIHHTGCDHSSWSHTTRCRIYFTNPFLPPCTTLRNTTKVAGPCRTCETEDHTLGNFGLIPEHTRSINNPIRLTIDERRDTIGPSPSVMPANVKPGARIPDAPMNSQSQPIDITGRVGKADLAAPADATVKRAMAAKSVPRNRVRMPKDPRHPNNSLLSTEPSQSQSSGDDESMTSSARMRTDSGGSNSSRDLPSSAPRGRGNGTGYTPRPGTRRPMIQGQGVGPIRTETRQQRNGRLLLEANRGSPYPKEKPEGEAAKRARLAKEEDDRRAKEPEKKTMFQRFLPGW